MNDDKFYLNSLEDRTMWVKESQKGEFLFSFDGKKIYNLFRDYPHALSTEEREIFDKENPLWAEYFSDRQ